MTQLGLLSQLVRVEKPHKRQRQTAREVYRVQRAKDQQRKDAGLETREAQVLRCLSAFWNRHQYSPTALELLAWMRAKGERVFDVNSVRPRIKALVDAGLVEPRFRLRCTVSGQKVWTWAVREMGSKEPR